MSFRSRFNFILFLGLLLLTLVFHNLASSRLQIIVERESPGYLLNRLPGPPILGIGAAVFGALVLVAIVWYVNRRFNPQSRRRIPARGRFVTIPLAVVFVLAGCVLFVKYPRFPIPQEWTGAAAAVVGVSLLFFAFLVSKRSLAVSHLVLLGAVVLTAGAFHFNPGHRNKVKMLRGFMATAMSDLEQRRRGWNLVNTEEMLADASNRADQHLVYRFEERLGEVTDLVAPSIEGGGVLFEIPRDGKFVVPGAAGPDSEIQDGKQVFDDYRGGTLLRTQEPLDMDWSDVGSFVITMTVSRGRDFQVFWGEQYDDRNSIRIPLGAPGESASYEIKERIIRYHGAGKVDHIWIIPSDQNARVEIESFQALDRTNAVLRGAPFSAGYENVGDEIRKVLFVATPTEITYHVNVPQKNPRLEFGLSSSGDDVPTTFEVSVGRGGRQQTVFSSEVTGERRWYDHQVDLSRWAGGTIDVTFKTSANKRVLGLWSNPVMVGEPMPNPNVVIYLIDALRADHLGAYGYDRNTSPVFDSLCPKGTLFERAYSNGTTTKYSIPSLFTSNPIAATGVRHQADVLPNKFPTLAEILRTMGYATASFLTNENAGPFSGSHQGFSRLFTRPFFGRYSENPDTPVNAGVLIGDVMQDWIRQNADRNFFLYVHTVDPHGPYDPPKDYRHYFNALESVTPVARDRHYDAPWNKSQTVEGRIALYDGEVEYGDVHLGRFVDMLDAAGVLDNTIIVVTADHAEFLGERGLWGHSVPMFVQGSHIPLLIVGPGFPAGARVGEPVQILDIMPTALEAMGFEPDPVLLQGKSLLPLAHGQLREDFGNRTVYIEAGHPGEAAFHCGPFHVIPELNLIFDLSGDPEEERYFNEFFLDFGTKGMGRKLLKEYIATYAALHDIVAPKGGGTLEVDPETLKQLRALGYIQ
jgi:arylsulfatase A-like enzyme